MTERTISTSPSRAWVDWVEAFQQSYVWIHQGFNDIRIRYRRSVIGPWWITIQTAVTIVFIGIVYSQIFQLQLSAYIPYLTASMILWYFAAAMLSEGCFALVESGPMLQQVRIPVPSIFLRVFLRCFLVFLHNAGLVALVLLVFGLPPATTALLFLPGLLLYMLNLCWMGLILGIIGLRYRDIQQILVAALNLLMLITPIFWNPEILPQRIAFVEINPFYHLLQIVRQPLLGTVPALSHWIWAVAMVVVGWSTALLVYRLSHRRLALWI